LIAVDEAEELGVGEKRRCAAAEIDELELPAAKNLRGRPYK